MEIGEYRLERLLSSGSMSTAFLGRRKSDDRLFILKQVSISGKENQKYAFGEVTVLSSLKHPNIVKYCDNFFEEKKPQRFWIVTEYCEKGDLSHLIELVRGRKRRMSEKQVLQVFGQICSALHYVHHQNVIHRDVKSSNIFISRDNVVKLGDFGISCRIRGEDDLRNTQIGSPIIASPEVFESKEYDFKTDVWSAGCVLYELLMLKLPFEGTNIVELKNRVTKGVFAPIPPKSYSHNLRNLVASMLAKNPNDRPSMDDIVRMEFIKPYVQTPNIKPTRRTTEPRSIKTVVVKEPPFYENPNMDNIFIVQIMICGLVHMALKFTPWRAVTLAAEVSAVFYLFLFAYVFLHHVK